MQEWTPASAAKLGRLKNLRRLTLTLNTDSKAVNSYAGAKMLEELANLDQLEVLNLVLTNYDYHTEEFH